MFYYHMNYNILKKQSSFKMSSLLPVEL